MSESKNYNPIDVILDWKLDFCLGSVVNCLSSISDKTDFLEELKKARLFLDKEIELCEKNTHSEVSEIIIDELKEVQKEKPEVEENVEEDSSKKKVDIPKILALRKAGWSQTKIADEMGLSQGRISQILMKAGL